MNPEDMAQPEVSYRASAIPGGPWNQSRRFELITTFLRKGVCKLIHAIAATTKHTLVATSIALTTLQQGMAAARIMLMLMR